MSYTLIAIEKIFQIRIHIIFFSKQLQASTDFAVYCQAKIWNSSVENEKGSIEDVDNISSSITDLFSFSLLTGSILYCCQNFQIYNLKLIRHLLETDFETVP